MGSWPFDPLTPFKYGCIVADPPWLFENYSAKGERKNPNQHYACMSLADIKALPVGQLAGPDCALVMWAIWPMLPQAIGLMAAWGFAFKSGGAWAKRTKTWTPETEKPKWAFGTGYGFRGACEPFLVGTIGNPQFVSRSERNLIEAPVREHSRKPPQMHESLERLFPNVWRAELFARASRPGWDVWGDQSAKFDGAAA